MITLDIERLAYGGDAIGHLDDGRTAFVSGGCPGDKVRAEMVEDHGRYVRLQVAEVLEPSPDRVAPPCPYFGTCGGCQWQHVSYEAQLVAKREAVVDALQRIGGMAGADPLVAECVPSPDRYGYRNKIELVSTLEAGRLRLGYHVARSSEVVPVESCLLPPTRFKGAPKSLTGALRYLAGETDLGITRVQLRVSRNGKDVEVALWTPPGAFPRAAAARTLGKALPLTSLVRVLHKGPAEKRAVTKVEVLSGKGHWRERLGDSEFAISAPSFFQINSKQAERLVQVVLSQLVPDGSDRVVDLYAGAGTFTLPLADLAGEVVAIESHGHAVRDLRRNLESTQRWAEVIGGDAEREISALGHFDLAVVDPPRAGLTPDVIRTLGTMRPRALAYVSCDPATLARDASALAKVGLACRSAVPIDLFPQTYHVETVATFIPAG